MGYSSFLESRKELAKELVKELLHDYKYVSLLGSHIEGETVMVNKVSTAIGSSFDAQCGFVLKIYNGSSYSEYSFKDIDGDVKEFAKKIKKEITLSDYLCKKMVHVGIMEDEPHVEKFSRPDTGKKYTTEELVNVCTSLRDEMLNGDKLVINAVAVVGQVIVSKMFISEHKDLEQYYTWTNGYLMCVMRDGDKMSMERSGVCYDNMEKVINELPSKVKHTIEITKKMLSAKHITPGEYDIICTPSISGLIAHEAFGHGVEMDMFVKNRAQAKNFIGQYVASPLVTMHDGGKAYNSVASYFFDDDGILAKDTVIIEKGILKKGISDSLSALQLGTVPTGNGRRESYKRKAYSRMTNTFFAPGKDKLDDMIKSIKHGYMLFETNNGMEDPKNWGIQCVAEYGIEIIDGKLTDNYVSPVVMSGYVPDLLKSISMVSKDLEVIGAGQCGKGYKEWVRVSDGGPYLKAKVKLG